MLLFIVYYKSRIVVVEDIYDHSYTISANFNRNIPLKNSWHIDRVINRLRSLPYCDIPFIKLSQRPCVYLPKDIPQSYHALI